MSHKRIWYKEPKSLVWISIWMIVLLAILLGLVLLDLNQMVMASTDHIPLIQKVWSIEAFMIFSLLINIACLVSILRSLPPSNSTSVPYSPIGTALAASQPVLEVATSLSQLIAEQKRIEEELRMREEWLSSALKSMAHAVIATDEIGTITFMNPTAEKLTGWQKNEAEGQAVSKVLPMLDMKTSKAQEISLLELDKSSKGKTYQNFLVTRGNRRKCIDVSAAPMKNSKGDLIGAVFVFQDVTDKKLSEEEMKAQIYSDDLTGLQNRRFLHTEWDDISKRVGRDGQQVSILFVDLDRFKTVNDNFGHEIGDLLLKSVAERLKASVSKRDLVIRWAGDEFLVVLLNVTKQETVAVAERILENMREPLMLRGYKMVVTPSIGISFYPKDGDRIEDIVSKADQAMYDAKKNGKNNYKLFGA